MSLSASGPVLPATAELGAAARPRLGAARALTPLLATAGFLLVTRAWGEYGNSIVLAACATVLVAAGLHVLVHWAGQVSLGQVAFVAIGAFVTARANADFGVPLPAAVVAGASSAALAGAVVGVPALRLRGFALAIATLAFGFAADQWLFLQSWLVPTSTGVPLRDESLLGFAIDSSRQLVIPVVLLTAAVVWMTVRLGGSALGRAMRLVAHDEEVAASYGISLSAHKLAAFLFAGVCAGLAGAVTVLAIGRVGRSVFPPSHSILYVSAVLLGGGGRVWGSLMAAASLGALPILLGDSGHWVGLVAPLSILLVVRTFPDGINGMLAAQAHAGARVVHALRRARHGSESG